MSPAGTTQRRVRQIDQNGARESSQAVVIEEPLEIRVASDPVAVTMRTPGDDARLALGFLFAEGIIRSIDDVGGVSHCAGPADEGRRNVIEVTAAPGGVLDADRLLATRARLTTSACGVCGRRSIEDLVASCGQVPDGPTVPGATLAIAMERLASSQTNFPLTGGAHAAAALDSNGALLAAFEDIGRHNAVDKVIGALLIDRRLPQGPGRHPGPAVLAVSGRASFEIIQKAARARIPIVASVSAASSLAIDLAVRAGITLAGFVRGKEAALYSRAERISE